MNASSVQNLREFLSVYNTLTENCFNSCVTNLNQRELALNEEQCVGHCIDKLVNANHRVMQIFAELGPGAIGQQHQVVPDTTVTAAT